jgi:cbb3-type cytochrome oxidase subunit 3
MSHISGVTQNLASLFTHVYFARGGGGGHGGGGFGGGGGGGYYGGGSSGGGSWVSFIFFLIIFFAIIIFVYRSSKKKLLPQSKNRVEWPDQTTEQAVSDIYYSFQKDWAELNAESMQAYLSLRYFYNVNLMLLALKAAGRRNTMEDVKLISTYPIAVNQTANQGQPPTMIVQITGQAKDSLVEVTSDTVFYTDTNPFSEYWHFVLDGSTWRLDNIRQVTEQENVLSPAIQNFASTNNYFYSGEWGWLLLPNHGQLFSKANFTTSAVNNHVIGLYKNCVIEFYSYLPNKNERESYTIAQAYLPKSYGDIIVHRKQGLLNITPHGLNKLSTEWPDFNKKYDVYATTVEQVTSFELLNPSFMEKVEALPFQLSIEVVDNVVYLYTKEQLEDYSPMLNILYLAFQEMKL